MHIINIFSLLDKENYSLIAFAVLIVFLLFVLPGVGFKKDVTRISESKNRLCIRGSERPTGSFQTVQRD